MVDWTTIVKNSKCVDKYFLWIWPDGTQKTSPSTKKIEIPKSTTSKIVDVEPCVSYRFSVELEEDELRGNHKFQIYEWLPYPSQKALSKTPTV